MKVSDKAEASAFESRRKMMGEKTVIQSFNMIPVYSGL